MEINRSLYWLTTHNGRKTRARHGARHCVVIANRQPGGVNAERRRAHLQPPPGSCAHHMIQMSVGTKEGSD